MTTALPSREAAKSTRPHAGVNAASAVQSAVETACSRVAPLWPLDSFVAVNPFVGLADMPFQEALTLMEQAAGARISLPRQDYQDALSAGRIADMDIREALTRCGVPPGAPDDVAAFRALVSEAPERPIERLPTIAHLAGERAGMDYQAIVASHLSRWAATYFDEGQAAWKSPWRSLPPYEAFRAEAQHDRSLELAGMTGIRERIAALPESPDALFELAAGSIGLPPEAQRLYFHRLLTDLGGWSGYARYVGFQSELDGRSDGTLRELLSIRLALECALVEGLPPQAAGQILRRMRGAYADVDKSSARSLDRWSAAVLQTAYELATQRQLKSTLDGTSRCAEPERPSAQLAFCIDVRSEVVRRALEGVEGSYATLGFAGFFGFPIEYVPVGTTRGHAHCPVLLKPAYRVREAAQVDSLATTRARRLSSARGFLEFKKSAISSFGFVEALGLTYLSRLVVDSMARSPKKPTEAGLSRVEADSVHPDLSSMEGFGVPFQDQVDRAESMLRGMSLTQGFAPLVVLVGHGSTSTNNPHASGLDCGACGGHRGAPNARVACAVLNATKVRDALAQRGIEIPKETVFLAGEHNTTTEEVMLFDQHLQFDPRVQHLRAALGSASAVARRERAHRFRRGERDKPAGLSSAAEKRAADWSEVRPEWGLANCSSFIVAPRALTRGINLEGRTFLHSYSWQDDKGFAVLESIMTAPMIVTSWISLQYYASTVDNQAFGCGNKTLHNVVGGMGVLEGAEGTLRSGLSLQSVHDGTRRVHEPVKLGVHIAAPLDAMNGVLERNPAIRQLLDHGWIYLLALDDQGRVSHRYDGALRWRALELDEHAVLGAA